MSDEKFGLILDELRKIHNGIDRHEQMITQLIGIVKSTNEKVAVLEVKMTSVEQKLTNVEHRLSNVEHNVLEVRKGQERQDRILEALAMRSLEQETDIREMKRTA